MKVNEIFRSIQGESSYVGKPCIFVRLTGCNLRCKYCDTKYAYKGGTEMTTTNIIRKIINIYTPGDIIEITGGEPLQQKDELKRLILGIYANMTYFKKILIETNGSILIPEGGAWSSVEWIMDWKCPSSGMQSKMEYGNLNKLRDCDELKFVIETDEDYDFMKKIVDSRDWGNSIIISTTWNITKKKRKEFVERILKDGIKFSRFQVQLHKIIWGVTKRGV